ncbi:MAG: hypothetical protein ACI9W6_002938 [Motiliproteus sp.]
MLEHRQAERQIYADCQLKQTQEYAVGWAQALPKAFGEGWFEYKGSNQSSGVFRVSERPVAAGILLNLSVTVSAGLRVGYHR